MSCNIYFVIFEFIILGMIHTTNNSHVSQNILQLDLLASQNILQLAKIFCNSHVQRFIFEIWHEYIPDVTCIWEGLRRDQCAMEIFLTFYTRDIFEKIYM